MKPQGIKMDWSYKPSKGYDCENEVYHKYGKDYPVKDYVNEWRNGTSAKEIIAKAGGLQNLPHALERIKDSEITIDMNEDPFTINTKLKLGAIAQRKFEALQAQKAALEAQIKQTQQTTNTEAE